VASPWHLKGEAMSDYTNPAVKGTVNILEQAAKFPSMYIALTTFPNPSSSSIFMYCIDDTKPRYQSNLSDLVLRSCR
jgi:hypothetical protein